MNQLQERQGKPQNVAMSEQDRKYLEELKARGLQTKPATIAVAAGSVKQASPISPRQGGEFQTAGQQAAQQAGQAARKAVAALGQAVEQAPQAIGMATQQISQRAAQMSGQQ